jgi:hypothetical protein
MVRAAVEQGKRIAILASVGSGTAIRDSTFGGDPRSRAATVERLATLRDLGVPKDESSRWQKLAAAHGRPYFSPGPIPASALRRTVHGRRKGPRRGF